MRLGERQKRNLQVLQDLATSTHGFRIGGVSKDGQNMEPATAIGPNAPPCSNGIYDYSAANSHVAGGSVAQSKVGSLGEPSQLPISLLSTELQPQSLPMMKMPPTPESSQEHSILSQLIEEEGLMLNEKTRIHILQKKITLQSILQAGLKALSHEASSDVDHTSSSDNEERGVITRGIKLRTDRILLLQNANTVHAPLLPDIHRNNFRIKQILYVAACVANSDVLGANIRPENCDDVESPFYRENISRSAAETICATEFKDLKTHLQPCAMQVMHKHHPYIDVLPFPTFRERVIRLAYVDEPLIDEDDLCNDLQNDGLVCWGSSLGGGSAAMGSGAPWDIRSWEAQPWFLKKWWILIGGTEGEIYKQTQWWCEMRGERLCNPW
jgi:Domain of unknown function (DUF3425)